VGRRCGLLLRWSVAHHSGVCAEESLQRVGSDPAGAHPGGAGIYSVIRNPSYLGLLIASLGWVLTFRSGAGVLLVASLLVPLMARIRAGERLLRSHFGAEYEAYCARTWRLLSGIY